MNTPNKSQGVQEIISRDAISVALTIAAANEAFDAVLRACHAVGVELTPREAFLFATLAERHDLYEVVTEPEAAADPACEVTPDEVAAALDGIEVRS